MKTQLFGLERSTASGGSDSIDHAARAHDDVITAAAIALVPAVKEARSAVVATPSYVSGEVDDDDENDHAADADPGGTLSEYQCRSRRSFGWPSGW